jgi:hypothetical protein
MHSTYKSQRQQREFMYFYFGAIHKDINLSLYHSRKLEKPGRFVNGWKSWGEENLFFWRYPDSA